jgi:prepilin-type N-terminal cleavage/methylation domain-containing protein
MKTQRASTSKRGFTLMELMVAMAITTIIVTVLVSITSIAIDTWNRSRAELRASRQAKAMIDTMARDFEVLVTRSGNKNEWLSAEADPPGDSSNASRLVFFTAATDRYNGGVGGTNDKGGDVSCVGYQLAYRDPISGAGSTNQTFVLNRYLVNPDATFEYLLGKTDKTTTLASVFKKYESELDKVENFVCENIYQFTITFQIEVSKNVGSAAQPKYQKFIVPIGMSESTAGQRVKGFRLLGTGIEASVGAANIGGVSITADEIKAGRLAAVEISATVLSDSGIDTFRKNPTAASKPEFLAKNSYQYTKLVQLPGM